MSPTRETATMPGTFHTLAGWLAGHDPRAGLHKSVTGMVFLDYPVTLDPLDGSIYSSINDR